MRCADCRWKYPQSILSQMFVNGGYTDPICGICALERMNIVHGIKRESFSGEMAEANRVSAILWRKSHPQDKPESTQEELNKLHPIDPRD